MTAPLGRFERFAVAAACVGGACGVALGAYAAHAAEPAAARMLERASGYLLLHGAVLLAWVLAGPRGTTARAAACLWLAGGLLFCGSLAGAALLGLPTRLAPLGGMALMAGWLIAALAMLRPPR